MDIKKSPVLFVLVKGSAVLYALVTSPIAGLTFLGYMIYKDEETKTLQNQLDAILKERKVVDKSISIDGLEDIKVNKNVTNFDIYKRCVIENYQGRFYLIQKPSGEYLSKIFLTQEDAKDEIDTIEPFLVQPVIKERRRVYNIRYVK